MSKYQALIDALKAGPTEGKWRKSKIAEVMIGARRLCNVTAAESLPIGEDVERANINAAYIAAANPTTIRQILADLEAAEKALRKHTKDAEQSAFENWLARVCPSGDVEDVHRQWEASSDFDENNREWADAFDALAQMAKGG